MDALQKITEAQMDANGVCSAPNVLNGTVAQNKAVFDKMVRQLVAPAYNAAVDAIEEINATETGIQAEEALRVTAESGRLGAENGRVSAEAERLSSETLRSSAESARIGAETARSAAESGRVNAENGRAGAEQGRVNAETARAAAEAARAATEVARVGAEAQRAAAESARNVWESFNAAKAYTAGNKVSYLGSSYVCIQAGTGNLPTNTEFWTLIAAKGVDGEGAGDMLATTYDPTGKAQDIFAYADQKASGSAATVQANLVAHTGRTDNPHGVTAAQIGAMSVGALKFTEVFRSSTPGAYTYTAVAGKTLLMAVIAGGGGGGGGGDNNSNNNGPGAGCGGGGGFLTITPIITVSAGTQIPIVVGAKGIHGIGGTTMAPAVNPTNGTNGGTSSFLNYLAYGGYGGLNGTNNTVSPASKTDGGAKGGNGGRNYQGDGMTLASSGESAIASLLVSPYSSLIAGGGGGGVGDYNPPGAGGISNLGNGGNGGIGWYGSNPTVKPTAGGDGGIACGGGGGGTGTRSQQNDIPGAAGGDGGPGLVVVYAMGE